MACHAVGTSSILVETATVWRYRLSVRTQGFHPCKRGSIPRISSTFYFCVTPRRVNKHSYKGNQDVNSTTNYGTSGRMAGRRR
jgi:hypothetical protein